MNEDAINSVLLETWRDLQRPQTLWQWAIIAGALAFGWIIAFLIKRALAKRAKRYVERDPGHNAARLEARYAGLQTLLMPLFAWLFMVGAERILRAYQQPYHLVRIAEVLAIAFVGIHVGLYAMRRVFKPGAGLLLAERWFGLLAWLLVALHALGFLSDVIGALSGPDATFVIGKSLKLSVWQILSAAFWVAITLVAALWAGTALETRLMHTDSIDGSTRIVLARFGKAVLIVIAVLVAMRLVDIDLTVLSVFGGALGVGLGLGLQRIASNYVSGFIILLDRSLRIGDVITMDKYNGSVTAIRTRCTVVRAANGVEALVPNELLLNQPVLNFSYGDKNGSAVTRVTVAYDSDLDAVTALMLEAANRQPRVLKDPAATAFLKDFGPDGFELELTYWVPDPEAGTDGLRSEVNRTIWREFQARGIRVPTVRRDVVLHGAALPAPPVRDPARPATA